MTTVQQLTGWFAGRVPDDWFVEPPRVVADRDEILVTGTLPVPALPDDADADARRAAWSARINGFREDTREHRIRIASEAEHLFGRKVSWACRCGDLERAFTTASVPVMTRLRLDERRVLDTLIDGGVARSRSEALAWCVKVVGSKQTEWFDDLREALSEVERIRANGPDV